MKKYLLSVLACLPLIFTASCDNSDEPSPASDDVINLESNEQAIIDSLNVFSLELFKNSFSEDGNNVVVSPYSLYSNLLLMANSAEPGACARILQTLGIGDSSLSDINALWRKISPIYGQFRYSNSLWMSSDARFNDDFKDIASSYYNVSLCDLPQHSSQRMQSIGNFFDENVSIPSGLIQDLCLDNDLMAISSIDFKGDKHDLMKEETSKMRFFNYDGSSSSVEMMEIKKPIESARYDGHIIIDVPYKDQLSLILISLKGAVSTTQFLETTSLASLWDRISNRMYIGYETIQIPKFEINAILDYGKAIRDMGIGCVSNGSKTMMDVPNSLDMDDISFQQFVSFKTDESVMNKIKREDAVCMSLPIVDFNYPFVFMLVDRRNDNILFIGKVDKL